MTKLPPKFREIFSDWDETELEATFSTINKEQWDGVSLLRTPNGKWLLRIPNKKLGKQKDGFSDWGIIFIQAMHFLGESEGYLKDSHKNKKRNTLILFSAQRLPEALLPFWEVLP